MDRPPISNKSEDTRLLAAVAHSLGLSAENSKEPTEQRFILSLSGGLDSVVLFHLLLELSKSFHFRWCVYHVNFGLRGKASQADENLVQQLCKRNKIFCFRFRAQLTKRTAIQEEARRQRLKILKKLWPGACAIEAHHADDRVETFLFRLLRGSGTDGLVSFSKETWRDERRVLRPLMDFRKQDLLRYAKKHRLKWREDRTNLKSDYSRNYLRNKIWPRLEKKFPEAHFAVIRLIEQLSLDNQFIQSQIPSHSNPHESATWEGLQSLPEALLNRWIRHWVKTNCGVHLSFTQTQTLAGHIRSAKSFSFNAPKAWVIRGKRSKRAKAWLYAELTKKA